jgi:hypothetical protein
VHWRNHLKFPEDAKLSNEARDLICRLLCDVDHRIGSAGADQIKVAPVTGKTIELIVLVLFTVFLAKMLFTIRHILGSKELHGINFMKWKQHLSLK